MWAFGVVGEMNGRRGDRAGAETSHRQLGKNLRREQQAIPTSSSPVARIVNLRLPR
jgi:hypothetical protein